VEIIQNQQTGDHVLARFYPLDMTQDKPSGGAVSLPSSAPILLLCHMDTVYPLGTINKIPFREVDGKIFGPGTLDMKGGIVIALAAIEEMQASGVNRPVKKLAVILPANISNGWRRSPR
jgi:acetylornithine deacetylase/succinyl-diaminopimelate desuccinylase-like protein